MGSIRSPVTAPTFEQISSICRDSGLGSEMPKGEICPSSETRPGDSFLSWPQAAGDSVGIAQFKLFKSLRSVSGVMACRDCRSLSFNPLFEERPQRLQDDVQ